MSKLTPQQKQRAARTFPIMALWSDKELENLAAMFQYAPEAAQGETSTEQDNKRRCGLDALYPARDRLAAMDICDPNCDEVRDTVVLVIDIFTQILGEHFPLMRESVPKSDAAHTKWDNAIKEAAQEAPVLRCASCGTTTDKKPAIVQHRPYTACGVCGAALGKEEKHDPRAGESVCGRTVEAL